ncbi:MAG: selenocysteine-specific translation elongation factor [Gammaproteobacteria bacterium]|nr:selenocysteine-specific translation elongation factor [Gammaproteobacteria bacterium]
MIVTLAGHVDHGKTSIVRALTGVDTDRLAEEKRRGLTIDLGFAYTDLGGRRVGFVDVPGHHRFVHNMVAGIAGRQYALLVVAADDGVMPQSREHLAILRLLGLRSGVVALTKIDRVSPQRADEVRNQIRALTAGTFLADAQIVALSCETEAGVEDLRAHLERAATASHVEPDDRPFRLPIDRAFTVRGSGVVVTGTVVSGSAKLDDRLLLASTGDPLRIRGLHVQDEPSTTAEVGDRAAVNIAGTGVDDVRRGDWLLDPAMRQPVPRFAVRLAVLEDFPRRVKHNVPLHIYHATSHTQGRILLIEGTPIEPGATAIVDLACEEPLHVKVGDRIVVRDHDLGCTLGGGLVVDLVVPASRRRSPDRRKRIAAAEPEDPIATLAALSQREPLRATAFARHWNLAPRRLDEVIKQLNLAVIEGHLLHTDLLSATSSAISEKLADHHRRHPDSPGLTAEEICTGDAAERHTGRLALAWLVERGSLRVESGRYADTKHQAAIPANVARLFEDVRSLLDSVQPPSLGDLAKRFHRPFPEFEREMRALTAFNLAVRVSDTRYFLPDRLLELGELASKLNARAPFTVRQFRDASGVGRNVVIEVLEYFDGRGFTQRIGDTRRVVGDAQIIHRHFGGDILRP